MPRRNIVYKKRLVDFKSRSVLVNKFINIIMKHGKKYKAEQILYNALKVVKESLNIADDSTILEKVLEKIQPIVEVKSRRIGGTTYQIPVVVRESRQKVLAMRWLIHGARKREKNKTMSNRLAIELIDAFGERGYAYKKREELHRLAEANKAFAHYRW